uniref:hypothetical protein n=1 Tax=Nitzschia dissipata TaxID=303402 RepID=UPI002027EAB3|nr:hypothetical protein NDD97_mgp19 [Nitzschia dissipata]QYB23066.1 hypothetical protein [Nitzschia dissipata]
MLAVTALVTIVTMTVTEAPSAATQLSQAWHTKTGLGRGYDCEIGDLRGKLSALKCQSFLGHGKFLEVAQKYSKDMIINDEVLEKILKDPEVYPIIKEKSENLIDQILLGFPS